MARIYCFLFILGLGGPRMAYAYSNDKLVRMWQLGEMYPDPRCEDHGSEGVGNRKRVSGPPLSYTQVDVDAVASNGTAVCGDFMQYLETALQAVWQWEPRPEFILWTGDSGPRYPRDDFDPVFNSLQNVSGLLRSYFPLAKVIPVLGERDVAPFFQYPCNDSDFYERYLTEGGWEDFLEPSAAKTFLQGGYYKVDMGRKLTMLVINTNLYAATNNLHIAQETQDPCGQLKWLEKELRILRQRHKKALIVGHTVPIVFKWVFMPYPQTYFKAGYQKRFDKVIARYSEVIAAQLYGHMHGDALKFFFNEKGAPVSVAFNAPPFIPWYSPGGPRSSPNFKGDPSARLFELNTDHGKIMSYSQVYLGIAEYTESVANGSNADLWNLLYEAPKDLRVSDLSTMSLWRYYTRLCADDAALDRALLYHSTSVDHVCQNRDCRHEFVCSMIANPADVIELHNCLAILARNSDMGLKFKCPPPPQWAGFRNNMKVVHARFRREIPDFVWYLILVCFMALTSTVVAHAIGACRSRCDPQPDDGVGFEHGDGNATEMPVFRATG